MTDIGPSRSTQSDKVRKKDSKSIEHFFGSSESLSDKLDALGSIEVSEIHKVENKREECFKYLMNRKHRGNFLVFNHQKFSLNAPERVGTELDKNNLIETATDLGFTVSTHDDMKWESIEFIINQHASSDHSYCDCFACVVLTHGESGGHLYAEDKKYHINSLIEPFQTCKSLVGKPKLFFIQACRGTKLDHGTRSDGNDALDAATFEEKKEELCIPLSADFLVGYSTVEGYYAWRNEENGSWFIQSLCACLREYRDMELLQIMTRVNRMVAYDCESCCEIAAYDKKKQMSSVVSQLTKDLYFNIPTIETVDGKIFKTKKKPKSSKSNAPTQKIISLKKQAMKVKLDLIEISKREEELKLELLSLKKEIYSEKLKNL